MSINFNVGHDNKRIKEVLISAFLGLQVGNKLNLKKHIIYIIPRLSSVCFAMRTVMPLLKVGTLKLVYFAYFHFIVSYRVIFWRSSTDSERILSFKGK
jgi:hypothetical protein